MDTANEQAMQEAAPKENPLRYVLEAQAQWKSEEKRVAGGLAQLDGLVKMITALQDDLADARTVIGAMAEADDNSDSGAIQSMAKTFLARTK